MGAVSPHSTSSQLSVWVWRISHVISVFFCVTSFFCQVCGCTSRMDISVVTVKWVWATSRMNISEMVMSDVTYGHQCSDREMGMSDVTYEHQCRDCEMVTSNVRRPESMTAGLFHSCSVYEECVWIQEQKGLTPVLNHNPAGRINQEGGIRVAVSDYIYVTSIYLVILSEWWGKWGGNI